MDDHFCSWQHFRGWCDVELEILRVGNLDGFGNDEGAFGENLISDMAEIFCCLDIDLHVLRYFRTGIKS